MYAVMKETKIVFGPVPDIEYNKVIEFLGKLNVEEKKKCRVIMKQSVESSDKLSEISKFKEQPKVEISKIEKEISKTEKLNTLDTDEFLFADVNVAFNSYLNGSGSSGDYWKPKDGRNLIRILPLGGVSPVDWKTSYPFVMTGLHGNVGLSMQEKVHCPRLTYAQPCPICTFVWQLYNSKLPDDIALAKKIKAYKSVLANIIDLSDVDSGVQKFAFGKKLAAKLLSYLQDPDTKFVLHPEKGNNFILIKKIIDNYPNYDESRFEMKATSVSSILSDWKEKIHNLVTEIKAKTYEELVEVLKNTKKAMLTSDESISDIEDSSNSSNESIVEVDVDELNEKLKSF